MHITFQLNLPFHQIVLQLRTREKQEKNRGSNLVPRGHFKREGFQETEEQRVYRNVWLDVNFKKL